MAIYTDLSIDQGADFESNLDLVAEDGSPLDLTGYTFSSQIRKSYYSSNASANITVQVVDASNGNTVLAITAANTANIAAGRYAYDVKMKNDLNKTIRIVEGIITVTPQVTK